MARFRQCMTTCKNIFGHKGPSHLYAKQNLTTVCPNIKWNYTRNIWSTPGTHRKETVDHSWSATSASRKNILPLAPSLVDFALANSMSAGVILASIVSQSFSSDPSSWATEDMRAQSASKCCACHEICTVRFTKCRACHEIFTSRFTKCCACHKVCIKIPHWNNLTAAAIYRCLQDGSLKNHMVDVALS